MRVHNICADANIGTIGVFLIRLYVDWIMLPSLALCLRALLKLRRRCYVETNVLLVIGLCSGSHLIVGV